MKEFNHNKSHDVQNLLKEPVFLSATSSKDILTFRRTIEASMKLGYWNGFVGLC